MNDYEFKLVKAQREFVWHRHPETDEVFFAVESGFDIELRDKRLTLARGDMAVIPKNVEHKPVCKDLCTIMPIEPKGTVNTGDAGGDLTDTTVEAI
ncbi:MAG: cupin domain-containing protein [Desulfobacter sp.]|nr:MAG: cupin domain-containing protein [Desulfobacter sp.]